MNMITDSQKKYILSLLRRLAKVKKEHHFTWVKENVDSLTKQDAGEWIKTLRQAVREYNAIQARYSINGKGKQI